MFMSVWTNVVNSSPHTRRYFPVHLSTTPHNGLFSAYAEVFPSSCQRRTNSSSLLRIRGGISDSVPIRGCGDGSSPHTRRYFRKPPGLMPKRSLFSAYAEVFPSPITTICRPLALLRIRGGISANPAAPAPPQTLLRIRGGISNLRPAHRSCNYSSPHTRRYFRYGRGLCLTSRLFSAYAEVFPKETHDEPQPPPLLRIRGGISKHNQLVAPGVSSSPHTRRYFLDWRKVGGAKVLFSAYAEVFPDTNRDEYLEAPLLRIRGGISEVLHEFPHRVDSSPHTRRYFHNFGALNIH